MIYFVSFNVTILKLKTKQKNGNRKKDKKRRNVLIFAFQESMVQNSVID